MNPSPAFAAAIAPVRLAMSRLIWSWPMYVIGPAQMRGAMRTASANGLCGWCGSGRCCASWSGSLRCVVVKVESCGGTVRWASAVPDACRSGRLPVLRTRPDGCPAGNYDNLVSMTRNAKTAVTKPSARRPPASGSRHWPLQDAKARFSELVRRVRSEGPQHVTVHGRDEVVVVAAEEFRRLKGERTGQTLIDALQASPHRKIDIEPARAPMPVRQVNL